MMKSFIDRPAIGTLVALAAGMTVPLGFAPYGWFVLPWAAFAVWMLITLHVSARRAVWLGWVFGFGMFATGVYWVHISIHLYGNASLWLALLSMFLLAAYLSLYPALASWLLATLKSGSRAVNLLIVAPAAWVAGEWLRGWLLTGFPWLDLGYSQIDSPLASVAPWFGVYGVGLLTLSVSGLLALAALADGWRWRLGCAVVLGLVLAAAWAGGGRDLTRPDGEPLQATLVQGNVSQDMKWLPQQQAQTLKTYTELSAQQGDSALLVWPETAIPAYYDEVEEDFIKPLRAAYARRGVSLITGIPVLDRTNWKYYNAVISLSDPDRYYYKMHLVPFGEYLPLRHWLERLLAFLPVPQADFSAGAPGQPLLTAAGYRFSASICYEVAFGEQLIAGARDAAWLVNVSNDAWFGDSAAPHQHLEMARMRALETGRYLLRATNTGISAIIDPLGNVVARSEQFRPETVAAAIEPRTGETPYMRWGNWPAVIYSLGWVLLFAVVRGKGINRKGREGREGKPLY